MSTVAPHLPVLSPQEPLSPQDAVAAERRRIARELHDVVGHALTLMMLQAAATARQIDADPPGARRAIEAIECTGREAMVEMRGLLGVLRSSVPPASSGVLR